MTHHRVSQSLRIEARQNEAGENGARVHAGLAHPDGDPATDRFGLLRCVYTAEPTRHNPFDDAVPAEPVPDIDGGDELPEFPDFHLHVDL